MPTYDYECDACGHEFELFQRITEDPLKKCPECKRNKLRRLFGTGAAVVFKGSGFYQTDYRSESYKKAATAAEKAGTESEKAGTESATGSKPQSAPDSKTEKSDSTSSTKSTKKETGRSSDKKSSTRPSKPRSDRKRGK